MQIGNSSIAAGAGQGGTGVFAGSGAAPNGDFLMGLFALLGIDQATATPASLQTNSFASSLLQTSSLSSTSPALGASSNDSVPLSLPSASSSDKAMEDKDYSAMLSNPAILQLLAALGVQRDQIPLLHPASTQATTTSSLEASNIVHLKGATDEALQTSQQITLSQQQSLAQLASLLRKADQQAVQQVTSDLANTTASLSANASADAASAAGFLDQLLAQSNANASGKTPLPALDDAARAQLEAWQSDGTLDQFLHKLESVLAKRTNDAANHPAKGVFTNVARALQETSQENNAASSPLVTTIKLTKTGQKTVNTVPNNTIKPADIPAERPSLAAEKNKTSLLSEANGKHDENNNLLSPKDREETLFGSYADQLTSSTSHAAFTEAHHKAAHANAAAAAAITDAKPVDIPVFKGNAYLLPIDQVRIHTTKALNEGLQHIKIELNPAELGRVDVQMEISKEGKTSIMITADRPETLDMLRKDSSILQEAISATGSTDGSTLQFSLRDGGAGQGQGQQQRFYEQSSNNRWSQQQQEEDNIAILHSYVGHVTSNNRVDIQI